MSTAVSEAPITLDTKLSPGDYERIRALIHKHAGIAMPDGKEALVASRLRQRLKACGISTIPEYRDFVTRNPESHELRAMIDVLTTNKTSFFREEAHFRYLAEVVVPEAQASRRLRLWSAGCSTGQEPYTTVICLAESLRDFQQWDIRILATDISDRVLAEAKAGRYPRHTLDGLDESLVRKYFQAEKNQGEWVYVANPILRKPVSFARLNLMARWPMKGPFDAIFCRNVMIYFDKPTQEHLVNRFHDLLRPGGHLLIGHSESLTGLDHPYESIAPATYRRKA
ncbi:MAG: protein-glutamate O-methyltransferase CheR [Acidobacteriota bacterium]|nr:protein-glutamate O-methyltransferase CheR [Acidobacteriota bacterium]MDQ7087799.1 protein-glutamate O-methyltransferase CheR [Acidobacteriota bacterium]